MKITLMWADALTHASSHSEVTVFARSVFAISQPRSPGGDYLFKRDCPPSSVLEIIESKGTIVTDLQEGAVCGIDGCAPGDIGLTTQASTSVKKNLSIEIISDAICPWCWVAKRRLDRALASLAPDIVANVTWHPFELNPGMPKAGLDRRAYRSRKFGSWEHSQALDAQVAATAKRDGLDFRHDRMERTPNTIDAHRLIWLAGREGVQDDVVEALFAAYFHDGRDVGDAAVLVDIGAQTGLDRGRVDAMLASDEGLAEVNGALERAAKLQVSGVPTVLVDGVALFSGAIRSELMETHLRRAVGHARI
jgi:predicted DsbA family dithiol-disulfide isomerase